MTRLAVLMLLGTGCRAECGLDWFGGGEVELAIQGDAGRVAWFVPGVTKVELDAGWAASQGGDVEPLEGAWLVHGHADATRKESREILLAVSSTLPPGQGCTVEHHVFLELSFTEDKDDPPRLDSAVFEVTDGTGQVLVTSDESLTRGEPTVSAAPYAEGSLEVPSNRWTVDPACTVPVRGAMTITWALDSTVRSGGARTCKQPPLTVDALRVGG